MYESSAPETILHLASAVEMRDATAGAHIDRIGAISAFLARAVGWSDERAETMGIAARLHDIGKIAIPERILLKPGPLTADERAEMQRHTTIGHAILSGSHSELLDLAATIALTHHERVDGRGYPGGLRGEAIPEAGRIVAVADVFDALVNDRVYGPAIPLGEASTLLRGGYGTQFDALVLQALLTHLEEVAALRGRRAALTAPELSSVPLCRARG